MARASQQESVSVVIRATDARDTIADTVESALRLADAKLRPEIVLVHDCSRDGTWPRLLDLKGDHPELHLVDLGSQYGSGLALVEGVRRSQGERVCVVAPGADGDTLARAVHEARRREAVLASLEESLGDTARERLKRPLFAQAFGPGVVLHVDRPQPAGRAADPHTHAAGRRRALLVVPLAGALAVGVALVLAHGSADEAPLARSASETAPVASPVATIEPDAPVLVAAEVPIRLGAGAQPRPRTERPVAPDSTTGDARARVASGGAAPSTPAGGADSGPAEPAPPASGGRDAGASAPPTAPQPPAGEDAAPAESSTPASPPADPVPPPSDEEPPPPESSSVPPAAEQPPEPPPAVTPPPESPSAGPVPSAPAPTPSAPPSPGGGEPAPTGPGNGSGQGNGHAYGQGNGNGNGGNGNGNGNGHNKH